MKNSVLINKQIHEIYSYKTTFGANVNVVCMKGRNLKQANITFNYGNMIDNVSINGKKYLIPAGSAHYMEHLMFNVGNGEDYSTIFEQLGAISNAGTGKTQTTYFFETSYNFDECLKILIKMVYKKSFTNKMIKKEFPIISEEINMINDEVYNRMENKLLSNMYYNNTCKIEIGGTVESISKIDVSILEIIHKCFYSPNNSNITIIGDFNPEDIFNKIEDIYKELDINDYFINDYKVDVLEEPNNVLKEYEEVLEEVNIPRTIMALKLNIPHIDDKELLKTEVAIQMLVVYLFIRGSNYIDAFDKMKVINESFTYVTYLMNEYQFLFFRCYIEDYERFIKEMKKLFNILPTIALDKDKFEVVKRRMIGERIRSLDDYESLTDVSDYYTFHHYSNDEYISTIMNMTMYDLVECLKYFKVDNNLTSLVFKPKN